MMNKREYCKKAWLKLDEEGHKLGEMIPLGVVNNLMAEFAMKIVNENDLLHSVSNNEVAAANDNGWITPTKEDIAAMHKDHDPC